MSRLAGVVAVLLALSPNALAQAPAGPTHAHLVATLPGDGGVTTDGRRYAVVRMANRLRVYNTKTGRSYDIATPCHAGSGAAGRFLISCPQANFGLGYSILDARRRTMTPVPGVRAGDTLGGIGRYWVQGDTTHGELDPNDPNYGTTLFIDWRTGARREAPRPQGCETFLDVDTPDLRPPTPAIHCAIYQFDGLDGVVQAPPRWRLVLISGRKSTALSSGTCLYPCLGLLGAGRATWLEQTAATSFAIRGYVVATGARVNWSLRHVRDPCDPACYPSVTHTADELFVVVDIRAKLVCHSVDERCSQVSTARRLYAMPWPRTPRG